MKKSVILIVGSSGSGKDTVADIFANIHGVPSLVSATTRPMRDGETNGKEHWFVDDEFFEMSNSSILAYTEFGGYKYAGFAQHIPHSDSNMFTYIIDEAGVEFMRKSPIAKELFDAVVLVNVRANEDVIRSRNVSEDRIKRDKERTLIPDDKYDYILENNKDIEALKVAVYDMWCDINLYLHGI